MTCDEAYINTLLSANEYPNLDQAKIDVVFALKTFNDLRPVVEKCAQQNDRSKTEKLVTLKGTVPVTINDSVYNIPMQVYLLKSHPIQAPFVFIRPSRGMVITKSDNVDKTGLVSHPYLKEWKSPRSNTHSLIVALSEKFAKNCPVYSKMKRSDSGKSLFRSLSGKLSNRSDDGRKKKTPRTTPQHKQTLPKDEKDSPSYINNNESSEELSECSSSRYSREITESFEELFRRSMELRSCPETPSIRSEDIWRSSKKVLKRSDELRCSRDSSRSYFSEDVLQLSPQKSNEELTKSFVLEDIETPRSSTEDMPTNEALSLEKVNESSQKIYDCSEGVRHAVVMNNSSSPHKQRSENPMISAKPCPFSSVGCKVQLGENNSIDHIEKAIHHHMNLLLIKTNSLETEIRFLEMRYADSEQKLKCKEKELVTTKNKLKESEKKTHVAEEKLCNRENHLKDSENKLQHVEEETTQVKKKLNEHETLLVKTQNELQETREKLKESEVKLSVTKEILCSQQSARYREPPPPALSVPEENKQKSKAPEKPDTNPATPNDFQNKTPDKDNPTASTQAATTTNSETVKPVENKDFVKDGNTTDEQLDKFAEKNKQENNGIVNETYDKEEENESPRNKEQRSSENPEVIEKVKGNPPFRNGTANKSYDVDT